MAKWGEGDERWKVQELGAEGTNVNNWHWTERDAMPFAKRRLAELFHEGLVLLDAPGQKVTVDGKVKVTGEAAIHNRRGKTIPAYELDVSFGWTGTAGGDGKRYSGTVKAPYISEENHDEDPEVQFTVKEAGGDAEKVRGALVQEAKRMVQDLLHGFVRELRSGGGGGVGGVGGVGGMSVDAEGSGAVETSLSGEGKETKTTVENTKQQRASAQSRTLALTESYYASSKDIYECFVLEPKVKAYTASACCIEPTLGGKVSMFGGSIEGSFTRLEPYERIEMDWRFSTWADGCMSKVVIELEEKERGSVTLRLTQTGVPEEDRFGNHDVLKVTEMGWRSQILTRIKSVFGYGL